MTTAKKPRLNRPSIPAAWYTAAGALLLLAFAQGWLFTKQLESSLASSAENLAALQLEVLDNRATNAALLALQSWWRSLPEGDTKRAALTLRDSTQERFVKARAKTIHEFITSVDMFAEDTSGDTELFTALQRETQELAKLYANTPLAALTDFEQPPWYLQPVAGLINNDTEIHAALRFNAGLYELYTGNLADALLRFEDLLRNSESETGRARVLFAIARLQHAIYEAEPDPAAQAAALDNIRQSLLYNSNVPSARQLLDYLLSTNRAANIVETQSEDGEGAGDGEGERGAISADPEKF